MAAYFVRYNCLECGQSHEVHDYIFRPDTDLDGEPITEAMFEDDFVRYRERLRCNVTGKPVTQSSDQFILVNAP
jgi:hypothetical protein